MLTPVPSIPWEGRIQRSKPSASTSCGAVRRRHIAVAKTADFNRKPEILKPAPIGHFVEFSLRAVFFKWIKQHLRIKAFYGTSENAVKTQIWIAVSIYVLVAIIRKRLSLETSLYQILQILSVTLFEKVPILQALQASDSQFDLHKDPTN